MSTAFVLSGGAGLHAIQVGGRRVPLERDVMPDRIVATSVGAVNALPRAPARRRIFTMPVKSRRRA